MSLRKTVTRENAHAVFSSDDDSWLWYVLKTYAGPAGESKKPEFARWFCLVTSPFVGERGEMGDTYIHDIVNNGRLVKCTREFADAYPDHVANAADVLVA